MSLIGRLVFSSNKINKCEEKVLDVLQAKRKQG